MLSHRSAICSLRKTLAVLGPSPDDGSRMLGRRWVAGWRGEASPLRFSLLLVLSSVKSLTEESEATPKLRGKVCYGQLVMSVRDMGATAGSRARLCCPSPNRFVKEVPSRSQDKCLQHGQLSSLTRTPPGLDEIRAFP